MKFAHFSHIWAKPGMTYCTVVYVMANIFDPEYLLKNDLVFIGSPETVARKLREAAQSGVFNCFFGEFNFSDLPEADLLRSIRLFGEAVIPQLRRFEPF